MVAVLCDVFDVLIGITHERNSSSVSRMRIRGLGWCARFESPRFTICNQYSLVLTRDRMVLSSNHLSMIQTKLGTIDHVNTCNVLV